MRLRNPIELTLFFNGKFTKASEAKVSVFDHSFLFGDGICEEMRAYDGGIFCFLEHFNRFSMNAKALGMTLPMGCRAVFKTVKVLLHQNYLENAHIRLVLSRGAGVPFPDPEFSPENTFCIIVSDDSLFPESLCENGAAAVTLDEAQYPKSPHCSRLVHCSQMEKVIALRGVREKGAFEGLYVNRDGFVSEGVQSSLFVVKDNKLLTPELSSGAFDRIVRRVVLKVAQSLKIETAETLLNAEDLFAADECFVAGPVFGIVPLLTVDDRGIGAAKPGQLTKYIRRQFKKYILSDILNTEKMLG